MVGKRLFITVGTTKFEKLIQTTSYSEFLDVIEKLGFQEIVYQTGLNICEETSYGNVKLVYRQYFNDFEEQIEQADLVISHAGAGTCLEVLKKHKPLLVVINEELMDNHQVELAEQLQSDEYLFYCTCDDLIDTLCSKDFSSLKPYPAQRPEIFSDYLDNIMGYV